jgi:hypothetical protein
VRFALAVAGGLFGGDGKFEAPLSKRLVSFRPNTRCPAGASEQVLVSIPLSAGLPESQFREPLGAVYSTKTFTLAARPAASITVRVE